MPDITGTNGADNIDVTNDNGTLNGTPQGTPIDNVRGRGGNDNITVTDSTISGDVRGGGGNDSIAISGSTVSGNVRGGAGGDTVSIEGSVIANVRLGAGDDELDFISTSVSGDIRGGAGTDSLNLPEGTIVTDGLFGTFTVTAGGSYSLSGGTFTLPSGKVVTYTTFENGTGIACFARNTLIQTARGPQYIQCLKVGDEITTLANGLQRIRWIGSRSLDKTELEGNPKLLPVRILAGSSGQQLPSRDLLVSRQHRMLVRSKVAERMFGVPEMLIPAIKLTSLPGIFVDVSTRSVEYYHLLFDQHEVVFADDAPSESLLVGPEALKAIGKRAREEIEAILPDALGLRNCSAPALHIPTNLQQNQLVARHAKNSKQLLDHRLLHSKKKCVSQR